MMTEKKPVQQYERLKLAPIELVIQAVNASLNSYGKEKAEIDGVVVKVTSKRMRTFAVHGTKCSCCGLQATHFAFERPLSSKIKNEAWHLNLYGVDGDGDEVLFTHDHTLARALGGEDSLKNTTTMCSPCNFQKSLKETEEVRLRREHDLDHDAYPVVTPELVELLKKHKAVDYDKHDYFVAIDPETGRYYKGVITFYEGNKVWFKTRPTVELARQEANARDRTTDDLQQADFFWELNQWIYKYLYPNAVFRQVNLNAIFPRTSATHGPGIRC